MLSCQQKVAAGITISGGFWTYRLAPTMAVPWLGAVVLIGSALGHGAIGMDMGASCSSQGDSLKTRVDGGDTSFCLKPIEISLK